MQLMSIKIGLLSVLLIKTCVRKKGGLGGFAPQTLTRSYYFEPPLSKKRSRATALIYIKKLELLKLHDLYKLEIAKIMHKLFNNKLPPILKSRFVKTDMIHAHKTVEASNRVIIFYRVSTNPFAKIQLPFVAPKCGTKLTMT